MSEPRYIHRDPNTGQVLGHYAHPNTHAQERVEEDHPDILAWQAERVAVKAAHMERKAQLDPAKLIARIAALEAKVESLLRDRS